jgi:hypothetical protein
MARAGKRSLTPKTYSEVAQPQACCNCSGRVDTPRHAATWGGRRSRPTSGRPGFGASSGSAGCSFGVQADYSNLDSVIRVPGLPFGPDGGEHKADRNA